MRRGHQLRAGLLATLALAVWLGGCFGGAGPAHSEYFVVPFEAGTAQPTADGRRALATAGEAARRGRVSRVVVLSSATANGRARAAAARAALAAAGVPAEKLAEAAVESADPTEGDDVTIQIVIGTPARPEKE
jgi:hypothetical protein